MTFCAFLMTSFVGKGPHLMRPLVTQPSEGLLAGIFREFPQSCGKCLCKFKSVNKASVSSHYRPYNLTDATNVTIGANDSYLKPRIGACVSVTLALLLLLLLLFYSPVTSLTWAASP